MLQTFQVFIIEYESKEFRLFHKQKSNCQYGHIPQNLKGNRNLFARVADDTRKPEVNFCRRLANYWKAHPETSRTLQQYGIEGFKENITALSY